VTYQKQLARVRRFLARVENLTVNPLELPAEKQVAYEDMLFTLFQNCWHLKDWIKNDPSSPSTLAASIEQLCQNYQSIMLSADIANGTKHLKLTVPRLGGKVVANIIVKRIQL
jgi:hypothetical protein